MKIEQYIVHLRVDVFRDKNKDIIDPDEIGKIVEEYLDRHFYFRDVEVIESEHIGDLDYCNSD